MSSLALRSDPWISTRMVDISAHEQQERELAGAALKILRKRAGLTQEAAVANATGISLPSWKNYEWGKRGMDAPTLARAVAAVGSTVEAHQLEVSRLSRPMSADRNERSFLGVEDRGRPMALPVGGVAHGGAPRPNVFDHGGQAEVIDFASYFAPGTRVLRLGGMSMVPYAEPGGFVTYNPRQPARRGFGAVIEMVDGDYIVKRFDKMDADTLYVTELYPEERELTFPLSDVRGVYAIGLRGD